MDSAANASSVARRRAPVYTLVAALLGWMCDGFEMGLFPVAARPALQDLLGTQHDADIAPLIGRITALFLVGAAFGGLLFGWLGDRVGRVRALSLSILTYSLFTGAAWFARSVGQLGALRFVASLGMGGEWALGVALVMEAWPEVKRPLLAGLIGAAANVGYALVATVALCVPVTRADWRWLFLVGALPALLLFFIRLAVPESQQWRAAVRARPAQPLKELLQDGRWRIALFALALATIPLMGTWGAAQWALPAWVDRMTGGAQPRAKGVVTLTWAIGASVGSFAAPLVCTRFGRRRTYFALCVASLLCTSVLFRALDAFGPPLLITACACGATTAAFYGWLPLYLPELFPTRVRATGQGFAFNFGRILAAAGTIGGGELVRRFDGDYARAGAAMALVYVLGMVVIVVAPASHAATITD